MAGVKASTLIRDTFTRTVAAGGWGTADQGGTWSIGGTAAAASVAGNRGLFTLGASALSCSASMALTTRDVELLGTVGWSALPVGGYADLRIRLRSTSVTGAGSFYMFTLSVSATGALVASLNASGTTISPLVTIESPHVPGVRWWYRVRAVGANPTRLDARVWRVGETEPALPQISVSDSAAGVQARNTYTVLSGIEDVGSNVVLSIDDLTFSSVEPGTLIVGTASLVLDFGGGSTVTLDCDANALELTPSVEDIDIGVFCEPSATEQGRVTYTAVATLLWSPALHTKLEPHIGQDCVVRFYPAASDTSRYITFASRYAAAPWGRFEVGQRVEVELPLAVLSTPDYVGELP